MTTDPERLCGDGRRVSRISAMRRQLAQAFDTVFRSTPDVTDGEHPDGVSPAHVRHEVRKHPQVHPAVTARPQLRDFRVLSDPSQMLSKLIPQPPAQTLLLALVVLDRAEQLQASFGQYADGYAPSRPSISCRRSSSETLLARPSSTAFTRARISSSQVSSASATAPPSSSNKARTNSNRSVLGNAAASRISASMHVMPHTLCGALQRSTAAFPALAGRKEGKNLELRNGTAVAGVGDPGGSGILTRRH